LDLVRVRGGSCEKKKSRGKEERRKKEDDVTCLPVRQIPAAQITSLCFYDTSGTFI
jgi:hypothetical protein